MRALITGGSGFVAKHLAQHLASCGDDVVPVPGVGEPTGVDVTDADAVLAAVRSTRPEVVYHLAALSHIGSSWDAPGQVFRVNAEGTLNVLRAATDVGADRVLVVGSADEYGSVRPEDLPLDEDAPLRPMTPYGASKVAADYLGLQAFLGDGLGVVRARSFNHTGPGQHARFVIPSVARRIVEAERSGRSEIPIGSLDAVRDFTDVRDVVRAYRLLVTDGTPGEVYNVCSGVGHSVAEIVDHLVALSSMTVSPVIDPELVRPVEVPRLVGDNTKVRTHTGWAPEISFSQMLADVLDDQRRRYEGTG